MADDTYNGWTNRETWSLMLWINNDEGLQAMAREYVKENPGAGLEMFAGSLFTRAGYVREFGEPWPDALADIAEDIGSMWRIDWQEATDSILSDIAESVA